MAVASEGTRVAREVGTDGKLGGQAQVLGVAGTWKDLTDNVNVMASNLTEQVRGIVKVVTAVAHGDLKQKLTVWAKGEVAALGETINSMTDTLATFAAQVSNVAHEVGVEGRLGNQASVPGASGTWRDLTGNVNQLAANLTTQVRARAARASGRAVRHRPSPQSGHGRAGVGDPDQLRTIRGRATKRHRAPRALRGQGESGDRAGLTARFHPFTHSVSRAAELQYRNRAQHHRNHHADGGPPRAVAGPGRGAPDPADGAASDQRAAGEEGRRARGAERRGRAQERRDRAGSPGAGRQGV